jgi:hypothetical protein
MANQPVGYVPTSSPDPLLSPDKQDYINLYKQYGFNPDGDNEFSPMARRWQTYLYPGASQNLEFFEGLQPGRRSAIQNLLNNLSPSGLQAQAQSLQIQAGEQGANAARQANLMNRSMGLGDGFNAGNTAAIMGQAAQTQNNIARQYADPQFQSQALAQLLGVYDQAANVPEMQMMTGLEPTITAQRQYLAANKSQGVWGQIAPWVGMAAGNPSMFKVP